MPTNPASAFVWSFLPNWNSPFSVTREYRTDIFTSRSQREYRRALRSTPRRMFAFESVIDGNTQLQEYHQQLLLNQDKPFIVPDWSRRAKLSAASASGSSTLTFDSVPAWVVEDRALFLFDGRSRPTPVYVAAIVGDSVLTTETLAADWSAGTTVVPGPVGRLAAEIPNSHPTNRLSVVDVSFAVEPTSEPAEIPAAASATLNGREICELRPNWAGGISQALIWPGESVDFGRGQVAEFNPFSFQSRLRRATFVAANDTEARAIEDFLTRMKGQRGEFYMPTGFYDLPVPLSTSGAGGNNMTFSGTSVFDTYAGSTTLKSICVRLRDGTTFYRTVQSIGLSDGNSVFTIAGTWPVGFTGSDVLLLSWLPVWRLASDSLTMDWLTGSVAQCDLSMRMLEDLAVES